MQFQILRVFLDLPRENCSATIFRPQRFSVTSLYFSLNRGGFRIQRILRKLRKVEVATIFYTLLFFVTFWFASLTRRGLRIQQIQRKWRKIGAATIFRISRFISASFLSSLTRRGLRIQLIPWKVRKKVPFPRFTIFPYVFIICQNGRCKTHCTYIASWRRSITRIESRNRINMHFNGHWRTWTNLRTCSHLLGVCQIHYRVRSTSMVLSIYWISHCSARSNTETCTKNNFPVLWIGFRQNTDPLLTPLLTPYKINGKMKIKKAQNYRWHLIQVHQ